MLIFDFSSGLTTGAINYYVFNPSVLHWKDDLYLIAYRIASYDIPVQYHPWKIWDNGYRFFKSASAAASTKYRNAMGGELRHKLESSPIVQKHPEFDSTGLAIGAFNGKNFIIKHRIGNLFPDEMNQDARLMMCEGRHVIIYNVFESTGVKLRCRDFTIRDGEIMLSRERYLFDHVYRPVEKHCVYGNARSLIHYGIGEHFEYLQNGILQKKPMHHFDYLYQKYGRNNVHISLSTPAVRYKSAQIAVGHAKIAYKNVGKIDLLAGVDKSKITPHGKYIYFMFLYEFADNIVKRVSPLFIPTINNSHLPYLLVMPIGMTTCGDKYLISYGEGDCRCKSIILNASEVEMLLTAKSEPAFLTESMDVTHVGYWGKYNCGDDAFEVVFRHLYARSPHRATFALEYNPKSHLNVLGGGDVINDYFTRNMPRNVIAVSVGIPYAEFVPKVRDFRAVYLRNENDHKSLTGTRYVPDLAFMLPKIYGRGTYRDSRDVGIVLIRTYYNADHVKLYERFCEQMAVFATILHNDGYRVHFIPFCINEKKPSENDLLIIRDVCRRLQFTPQVFTPGEDYVRDVYNEISRMGFNICSRFHSHIFSTIHAVPFISLTCGRKCVEYMRAMPDCLYRVKSNDVDLPIDFDGEQFSKFFKAKWHERANIHRKLNTLYHGYARDVSRFEESYGAILRESATGASARLWIPPAADMLMTGSSPQWRNMHHTSSPPGIGMTAPTVRTHTVRAPAVNAPPSDSKSKHDIVYIIDIREKIKSKEIKKTKNSSSGPDNKSMTPRSLPPDEPSPTQTPRAVSVPMSVQSTPMYSVPIQSVPMHSVPVQSVPMQSVPVQSVQSVPMHSVQSVPMQYIQSPPAQLMTAQQFVQSPSVSAQSMSLHPVSQYVQSVPTQYVSVQNAQPSAQSIVMQSVPMQVQSMQSVPMQVQTVQSMPMQVQSMQSVPMQSMPVQSVQTVQSVPMQSMQYVQGVSAPTYAAQSYITVPSSNMQSIQYAQMMPSVQSQNISMTPMQSVSMMPAQSVSMTPMQSTYVQVPPVAQPIYTQSNTTMDMSQQSLQRECTVVPQWHGTTSSPPF